MYIFTLKIHNLSGWGFCSVVERLPSKPKALYLVPSSEKKREKKIHNLGFLFCFALSFFFFFFFFGSHLFALFHGDSQLRACQRNLDLEIILRSLKTVGTFEGELN